MTRTVGTTSAQLTSLTDVLAEIPGADGKPFPVASLL